MIKGAESKSVTKGAEWEGESDDEPDLESDLDAASELAPESDSETVAKLNFCSGSSSDDGEPPKPTITKKKGVKRRRGEGPGVSKPAPGHASGGVA